MKRMMLSVAACRRRSSLRLRPRSPRATSPPKSAAALEPYKKLPEFQAAGEPFDAKPCMADKSIISIPASSAIPFLKTINDSMTKIAGRDRLQVPGLGEPGPGVAVGAGHRLRHRQQVQPDRSPRRLRPALPRAAGQGGARRRRDRRRRAPDRLRAGGRPAAPRRWCRSTTRPPAPSSPTGRSPRPTARSTPSCSSPTRRCRPTRWSRASRRSSAAAPTASTTSSTSRFRNGRPRSSRTSSRRCSPTHRSTTSSRSTTRWPSSSCRR